MSWSVCPQSHARHRIALLDRHLLLGGHGRQVHPTQDFGLLWLLPVARREHDLEIAQLRGEADEALQERQEHPLLQHRRGKQRAEQGIGRETHPRGILEAAEFDGRADRGRIARAPGEIVEFDLLLRLGVGHLPPNHVAVPAEGAIDRHAGEIVEELNAARALALADARDGQVVLIGRILGQERLELGFAETATVVGAADRHHVLVAKQPSLLEGYLNMDAKVGRRRLAVLPDQVRIDSVRDELFENDIGIGAQLRILDAASDIERHCRFKRCHRPSQATSGQPPGYKSSRQPKRVLLDRPPRGPNQRPAKLSASCVSIGRFSQGWACIARRC